MTEETVVTNQEPTAENPNPVTPENDEAVVEEPTLLSSEDTDSPEAGDAEKPEAPEKYEITMPEGMELDEDTLGLFEPIFKELGITNEGAQKLVDAYIPLIQSTVDKQRQEAQEEYKGIVDGWKEDTMKELGSTAKADLAACGKAIEKFGSPELREMMQETGVGNHKELVKFMVKIGKSISEDSVVDPNSQPPASGGLHTMYPSMNQ